MRQYGEEIKAKFPGIMGDFPFDELIDAPDDFKDYIRDLKRSSADAGTICSFIDALSISEEYKGTYWKNISNVVLERVANTYRSTEAYERILGNINSSLSDFAKLQGDNRTDDGISLNKNAEFVDLLQRKRYYLDKYVELVMSGDYDNYIKSRYSDEPDIEPRRGNLTSYHSSFVSRNVNVANQLVAIAYNASSFLGAKSFWGVHLSYFLREKTELMESDYLKKAIQILQAYYFNEHELLIPHYRVYLISQETTLALCYYFGLEVLANRETAAAYYRRIKCISEEDAQKLKELCPEI